MAHTEERKLMRFTNLHRTNVKLKRRLQGEGIYRQNIDRDLLCEGGAEVGDGLLLRLLSGQGLANIAAAVSRVETGIARRAKLSERSHANVRKKLCTRALIAAQHETTEREERQKKSGLITNAFGE